MDQDFAIKYRHPAVIMVHLPFDQHCKVALQSGCTVIEKVGQKLTKRMVPPEACSVKEKRKSGEERAVNWNEDLSKLDSDSELAVVLLQPTICLQHKLIQDSTFFIPSSFCDFCMKRIYRRCFRCEFCHIKFHGKCGSKIPTFCRPAVACLLKSAESKKENKVLPFSIDCNNRFVCCDRSPCFSGAPKPRRKEGYFNNRIKQSNKFNVANENSNLELNPSLVTTDRQVDEGTFGYVFKGEIYHAGKVAIKVSNKKCFDESEEALENEYKILKLVRHANVLMLKGYLNEPRALVTQWCENLSLYQHLHVNEPATDFSTCESINISKQIAQGMNYLHSLDILHRDLKSKNIFLTDDMTVKIGDFGHAIYSPGRLSTERGVNRPVGSPLWMAPEVIRNEGDSIYSDVYSCGIIYYEIASGQLPYVKASNADSSKEFEAQQKVQLNEFQIVLMVGRGLLKPDMSNCRSDFPRQFKSLIEKCIRFRKNERPDFKTILHLLDGIHLPTVHRSASVVFTNEAHTELSSLIVKMKKESYQCDDRYNIPFRNSR